MSGSRYYKGRSVKGPAKSSIIERHRNNDGLGPKKYFWRRKRILISILAFFGEFNKFTNRTDLFIAITTMVKHHGDHENNSKAEFDWDEREEGLILSSFSYGCICTEFVGGLLATRFGGVLLFGFGVGIPSFLSIFTDYNARSSYISLIVHRVLQGLLQGLCSASLNDIWTRWLPPLERTALAGFAYSGAHVGTGFAMLVSGYVIHHVGWPAVFHLFGGLGTVWYGFWLAFVYRIPEDDLNLDPFELEYLQSHLVTRFEREKTPWRKIFTSGPVYALIVARFVINWSMFTLMTGLPTYMRDIFHYHIIETGFFASVPYFILFLSIIFTGISVNYILRKNIMSVTSVRKIYICVGFLIQGSLLFFVGFVKTPMSCILLVTIGLAASALTQPNCFVNHLDLSPQHACVLFGISGTIAEIPGIMSPLLKTYIEPYKTREEWRTIFMVVGCICLFGSVVYFLFGSGEVQEWSVDFEDEDKEK